MTSSPPETVHASAVLVGEAGVLLRGPSGSGKSSLALDLLDRDPEGTRLVADDRVVISARHGRVLVAPPPVLAGLLEVRGRGIVPMPHVAPVVLRLLVDLDEAAPRMPEDEETREEIAGIALPRLALRRDPGNAARIRAVLSGRGFRLPPMPKP